MTRDETKERIKVMQAYADGKQVQMLNNDVWIDISEPHWESYIPFRIKPQPKYRPFKNADEAFQEAKKHGFWVHFCDGYVNIAFIDVDGVTFAWDAPKHYYDELINFHWADDDTPCGILEQ